jgi:hypothetical protein
VQHFSGELVSLCFAPPFLFHDLQLADLQLANCVLVSPRCERRYAASWSGQRFWTPLGEALSSAPPRDFDFSRR